MLHLPTFWSRTSVLTGTVTFFSGSAFWRQGDFFPRLTIYFFGLVSPFPLRTPRLSRPWACSLTASVDSCIAHWKTRGQRWGSTLNNACWLSVPRRFANARSYCCVMRWPVSQGARLTSFDKRTARVYYLCAPQTGCFASGGEEGPPRCGRCRHRGPPPDRVILSRPGRAHLRREHSRGRETTSPIDFHSPNSHVQFERCVQHGVIGISLPTTLAMRRHELSPAVCCSRENCTTRNTSQNVRHALRSMFR